MKLVRFAAALTVLSCVNLAAADTIVTIGASKDNTLYESTAGTLSNGSGQYFFAGLTNGGEIRRGLIAFDIAGAVPAGSVITGAKLTLHMSKSRAGAEDVSLHPLSADWGEGASDAPLQEGGGTAAAAGDATWLHTFSPGQFWTTPGGDFAVAASATTSVGAVGFYDWSSAGMIADVQSWLDAPAGNYGWLLMGDEATSQSTKRFDTRENPEASVRPVLEISYIPEPGSLMLLGFAALPLLGRRR
jgi:hypothetical protein